MSSKLIEFFKLDDFPGFIKEWRRQNPGKYGASQCWFDMALRAGVYD